MRKCISFIALILLCALPSIAEPQIPEQTAWVMDTAQVMSTSEKATLEQYLTNLDLTTGVQIAVFTVDSLDGYALEDYSLATVEKWQIGQKNSDNGVLLFIAMSERKIRIEVGYGLEGMLTDMKSGLIIRNVIAPYFRDGQTGTGIIAGVQAIANTVAGENAGVIDSTITVSVPEKESAGPASGFSFFILFVFFILMIAGFSQKGSRSGRYQRRSATGEIIHTAIWISILSSLFGPRGPHDGFGGGSGFSSGSGSSFGGGGFSGGGGGSFGGGGASGGW
jgi:uncharacterized protein